MEEVFNTISAYQLVKKHTKLMVGVSGGPDSIALLRLLHNVRHRMKLDLLCVHFNHMLRPRAADDERFVKKIAQKFSIPFVSAQKDVGRYAAGDSLEQTARFLRYDFFYACARQYRIRTLALGHTRDDVVETVLMRIIRGASLRGLRSIQPKSQMGNLKVIRPLIEVRKDKILAWLKKERQPYVVDESNLELDFFRNKVRHKLLPLLKEYNPNIEEGLCNLACNAGVDYDFIHTTAFELYNKLKRGHGRGVLLNIPKLMSYHKSLISEMLRCAIQEVKGNLRRIEAKHVKEIYDLIKNRPQGSVVHIPGIEIKLEEQWISIKSLLL